jgi:signal transduction histidine kinase
VKLAIMENPSPRSTRPLNAAWLGGVCAGLADHLGWSVLALRAVFVVLAATRLAGVVLYLLLWLVMPRAEAGRDAPGLEAAGRTGLRQVGGAALRPVDLGAAGALALLGSGLLWLVQANGWGLSGDQLAAGLLAAGGLGLIWWQADRASTREVRRDAGLQQWFGPLLAHWTTIVGIVAGLVALGAAIAVWVLSQPLGEVARLLYVLGGVVAALVAAALPWVLRVRGELARAREDKLLADARADMAAHLHDSVLQTLALIQRRAGDSRAVIALARRQERELRQWLYGQAGTDTTLVQALSAAGADVEADHGVDVDLVTVGDAELTPELTALVRASREAMVNAARHSGAERIDVYAEVDDELASVYVRDRGSGFDPDAIDPDRMGLRRSIVERVERAGGQAIIRSSPGAGSEIRLEMHR